MDDVEEIISPTFPGLKGKHCTLGIDEAGRGPVLGPMVYGGFLCLSESLKTSLTKLGVADSKALSEERRDQIFEQIKSCESAREFAYLLRVISPRYINSGMLARTKFSLNAISHEAAAKIIAKCREAGILLDAVFLDTVGPCDVYQTWLESKFPDLDLTVSNKAVTLFPVVSAASICAKSYSRLGSEKFEIW